MKVETLTEKVTSGKCSAVLNYRTKQIINIQYDGGLVGISFEGAAEMSNFWKLIAERLDKCSVPAC